MNDSRLRRKMVSFLALVSVVATGAVAQINEQEAIVHSPAAQDEALLTCPFFSCASVSRHIDALQDNILPNWSRTLVANDGDLICFDGGCFGESSRFKTVFNGFAVLDKETGLVWEVRPRPLFDDDPFMDPISQVSWASAVRACQSRTLGGRMGWRLATVEEISTLIINDDPFINEYEPVNNQIVGDVFTFASDDIFWTSSTAPEADDHAYILNVGGIFLIDTASKSANYRWWCVRGPGY